MVKTTKTRNSRHTPMWRLPCALRPT